MQSRLTYASLLVLLILVGCSHDAALEKAPLEDDLGRTVELDSLPQRVVTLAPSLTEIVFAAGAGHKLVGVGTVDDYPPAIDTLPRYSTYPLDYEAIATLEPDLALATDQVNSPRDAETLDALGIPTYFLSFGSLEDVFGGVAQVGELLGTQEVARAAADSLRSATNAVVQTTSRLEDRPSVLFLIGSETLFAFGNESYVHDMIAAAGGHSITGELDVRSPTLSEEYVLRQAPEVIMGMWEDKTGAASLLENHPTWNVVPAVENGRIFGIHPSLVSRPGPRLVQGIRLMAEKLHPQLFEDQSEDPRTP